MRAALLAVALLACAALAYGQDFRYPKTVVVTAVYNSTTLQSDPITVDEISAAPWSKRSWNKTPRPASVTSFQVVVAYKPAGPVANCAIETPNNTAFTCTFNGTIVAVPLPLVVQYVAATSDNNTAVGYAIIKPVFVKPGGNFGPQPVYNGTHPWFNGTYPWFNGQKPEFNGTYPWFNGTYPWFNGQKPEFNGTYPWFNGTHPWFNGTYPWFIGQKPEFNGSFPWFGDKTFNRTFHHHRRHNKTLLGH